MGKYSAFHLFIDKCTHRFIDTFKYLGNFLILRMPRDSDSLSRGILKLISQAGEPLETKEIEDLLKKETRTKVLYRLNRLRGDSLIEGKAVGSGKGTWIWWKTKQVKTTAKIKER